MPFKVKRIFFINGKKNFIRGQHAHKRCSQYLFSLLGKIEVKIINKKGQKKIILNHKKNYGFLIKPLNWISIKFLTKKTVLMVACDQEYVYRDYIENFSDFKKIVKL